MGYDRGTPRISGWEMAGAITAVFTALISVDTLLRTTAQLLHELRSSACRHHSDLQCFGHLGVAFLSAAQVRFLLLCLCFSAVNQGD